MESIMLDTVITFLCETVDDWDLEMIAEEARRYLNDFAHSDIEKEVYKKLTEGINKYLTSDGEEVE